MTTLRTARMLTRYNAWANELMFNAVVQLPPGEAITYHHGFVADFFYQIPAEPPTTDLPVFLRDVPLKLE